MTDTFQGKQKSRWLPHWTDHKEHKNDYKSMNLADTEPTFGVVVAEAHPKHTL